MKGTFKVTHDTVTIEEFSYPLEQFLIDEPKFKAPDADQLVYERGEGCLLFKDDKAKKAEKEYPSDLIELFIARKRSYRGAFKARRNAAANNQTLQNDVVEPETTDEEVVETPQEQTDANAADPNQENADENGDGDQQENPDETKDEKLEDGDGNAENKGEDENANEGDETPKPEDQESNTETKGDESEKPQDEPVTKENKAEKKAKSQKKKENKDGNN